MDQLGAALAAEDLSGPVCDDLIGVRVSRRARTRLVDVDRKLIVELPIEYVLARRRGRAGAPPWQAAQLPVRLRCRTLDHPQGADETAWHRPAGDGEVDDRTLGRGAVIGVGWDLHLAHRVALDTSAFRHAVILEFQMNASRPGGHRVDYGPCPGRRPRDGMERGRAVLRALARPSVP